MGCVVASVDASTSVARLAVVLSAGVLYLVHRRCIGAVDRHATASMLAELRQLGTLLNCSSVCVPAKLAVSCRAKVYNGATVVTEQQSDGGAAAAGGV
jgi:hypothetical protein